MTSLLSKSGPVLTSGSTTIFNPAGRPLAQAWGSTTFTVGSGVGPLSAGLTFGDVDKGCAYFYNEQTVTGLGGSRVAQEGCLTAGIMLPQEWGPPGFVYDVGKTIDSAHELADIDLGAAPKDADGTVAVDYVEMTINLTRTVTPLSSDPGTKILDPWPLNVTAGAWIDFEDGACVIEQMAGFSRQFWVDIVDERIVLRRRVSIADGLVLSAVWGNPTYQGVMTHVEDIKYPSQPGGSASYNLGQANACSMVNTMDYTSTYTGTIIVTPVNYRGND